MVSHICMCVGRKDADQPEKAGSENRSWLLEEEETAGGACRLVGMLQIQSLPCFHAHWLELVGVTGHLGVGCK